MKTQLKQLMLKIIRKLYRHSFGVSRFEYDDHKFNLRLWGIGSNLSSFKAVLSSNHKILVEDFLYPRPDIWETRNKKKPKDHFKEARFLDTKSNFDFNEKNIFELHVMLGKRCIFKQRITPIQVDQIKEEPKVTVRKPDAGTTPFIDTTIAHLFSLGVSNSVIHAANTDMNRYISDILAVCASLAEENEQLRAKINKQQ